jgi:hypothetical protein
MENQSTVTNRKVSYVVPSSVLCITLILANSSFNIAAYGESQNSSFQAEVAVIDKMP